MKELTVQATTEALPQVQVFIEEALEAAAMPMRATMQISVCVEEMFVNIAHYAYRPAVGSATVRFAIEQAPARVMVQFEDAGVPFDPLAKTDADTTLSAEAREIGGLGILMVKKSMDAASYARTDGKNIFTMYKNIG